MGITESYLAPGSNEAGTRFSDPREMQGWVDLHDVNQANHTIDEKKTTVIDREQDRPTRWIKEAVHIRKEGHRAMNRDEGSYQLSHAYDRLLDATADRRIKTRKNWVPASSDEISWWDRNVEIMY